MNLMARRQPNNHDYRETLQEILKEGLKIITGGSFAGRGMGIENGPFSFM
jgi:hypothetical protein